MTEIPKPPKHLKPTTKRWFEFIVGEYALESHQVRILTLACQAWDRGEQAREILKREGLTFIDRFGSPKARPEVSIERDSRIGFARLVRELCLDVEIQNPDEERPPRMRA